MNANKFLNLIETKTEHDEVYKFDSSVYSKPWLSFCKETKKVSYNIQFFHKVGKVGDFYYSNGLFSTEIDFKEGIPIGIMVIEKGFIPSSPKGRVMSLLEMNCTTPNSGSTSYTGIYWGNRGVEITELQNFAQVIHGGSGSIALSSAQGVTNFGYLPSDRFSYLKYSGDSTTYFSNDQYHIISPYLTDDSNTTTFNTDYIRTTYSSSTVANMFSDLDGYSNTEVLTNDTYTSGQPDWKTASAITNKYTSGYSPAACCCKRFEVGGLDWYLPAMGELGFIMPRFNVIQKQLTKLINKGGNSFCCKLYEDHSYWSSSEKTKWGANFVYVKEGSSGYYDKKHLDLKVRAFALV